MRGRDEASEMANEELHTFIIAEELRVISNINSFYIPSFIIRALFVDLKGFIGNTLCHFYRPSLNFIFGLEGFTPCPAKPLARPPSTNPTLLNLIWLDQDWISTRWPGKG